jgi:phytoene dehydrogenase-like protein
MSDFDAIVVGAGHNGLTRAGCLAKAGRRVKVLERRSIVRGSGAHPGRGVTGLPGRNSARAILRS